ncbi:AGE family epimerase/isomerase [Nocardioides ferulae]|uniref:AGE family epimerase/isomerase n=1 Tax=Nocardioides ferulae TaxID=2340821 RepID=UPI000EB4678F|nr:AGE family epimerase/isomerase [Nocardioides ferulae]
MDLDREGRRLLAFARGSVLPGTGFGWLDDHGRIDPTQPVPTYLTARMTHVFALAALRGEPGAEHLAATGVEALASGPLRDVRYGGWWGAVHRDGTPVPGPKLAYDHAFVVLAASSAVTAEVPGADALLDDAVAALDRWFLDDRGRVVDSYPRDLSRPDDYRGANSSMHTVEALLALGDVRSDPRRHAMALDIAAHLVHEVAGGFGHRLPEHFGPDWTPLPDYNADRPDDQFRPYGVTPGHLLEWARLLLQLEASLDDPPPWLLADARALFARAVEIGWAADGEPGFVYTTDWRDRPVVRSRMHWVHAEAVATAAALGRRTGEQGYAAWETVWWQFLLTHFIEEDDPEATATAGEPAANWRHELDEHNRPSGRVWSGRPDVYHAYQATLLCQLQTAPSLAVQLA